MEAAAARNLRTTTRPAPWFPRPASPSSWRSSSSMRGDRSRGSSVPARPGDARRASGVQAEATFEAAIAAIAAIAHQGRDRMKHGWGNHPPPTACTSHGSRLGRASSRFRPGGVKRDFAPENLRTAAKLFTFLPVQPAQNHPLRREREHKREPRQRSGRRPRARTWPQAHRGRVPWWGSSRREVRGIASKRLVVSAWEANERTPSFAELASGIRGPL